jgi:predicted RNase H-like HicB family nuclease
MKYHFKVHKDRKSGYWAHCLERRMGVTTQGETMEELRDMIQEALDLAMDEPMDSDWMPPDPDPTIRGRNIIEVQVSPRIAMASTVRVTRLKAGLTHGQSRMAHPGPPKAGPARLPAGHLRRLSLHFPNLNS